MTENSPSFRYGVAGACRLWPLVVALWLLPVLILIPSTILLGGAFKGLGDLPPDGAPAGDFVLVFWAGLQQVRAPLLLSLAVVVLVLWQWNLVWRAGVVSWLLWFGGGPISLTRLVGLGLVWWWRYLRLSLCSLAVAGATFLVVWLPLNAAVLSALGDASAEHRVPWLLGFGCVLSLPLWLLWWVAGLRGTWILGRPDRRSAFLALITGLWGALRRPLPNFGLLLLWALPLAGLHLLPLLLGSVAPDLSSGLAGVVLLETILIVVAFIRLALLLSYAPVSGLVDSDAAPEQPR